MKRRGVGRRAGMAPRHLAGWLFADLFLVLFIIALGMLSTGADEGDKSREPDPSTTPSPTKSEKPPEQGPGGLDPDYRPITVELSRDSTSRASGRGSLSKGDAAKVRAAVRKEMRRTSDGRRIGMVITWGLGPQTSLDAATALADDTNRALRKGGQDTFCGSNVGMRSLWKGRLQADAVKIEIYYVNACADDEF